MPQIMVDRYKLDDKANIRVTSDGYLVATPRIARTGIQVYAGYEVGRPDLDRVNIYRPESEVMHADAVRSMTHRPITNDHPPVPVTADNWKKYAVGNSGDEVLRDGEFIRVPMTLMDAGVIRDFREGKAELSVGYTCDLKWEKGTDPATGQQYDAIQTNIRGNHIAVVDSARGGVKLRIGDNGVLVADTEKSDENTNDHSQQSEDTLMADLKTKTIVVDGVTCVMEDTAAQVVQRFIDTEAKKFADAMAAKDAEIAKLKDAFAKKEAEEEEEKKKSKEAFAKKDAEIAALEAKLKDAELTPEKLNALVKDRAEVIGKAVVLLGDKAPKDIETKDTAEIHKLVVQAKMGDRAKDYDAGQFKIAFDTLTADVKVGDKPAGQTFIDQQRQAFSQPAAIMQDAEKRQKAYDQRISNAWKTGGLVPPDQQQ